MHYIIFSGLVMALHEVSPDLLSVGALSLKSYVVVFELLHNVSIL